MLLGNPAPTTSFAALVERLASEGIKSDHPLILVSDTTPRVATALRTLGWGQMWCRERPRPADGERWAMDNGAFSDHRQNRPFDEDAWLATVRWTRAEVDRCANTLELIAIPDIVGGGMASLERSLHWVDRLQEHVDLAWYLVMQEGMELQAVEDVVREHGEFIDGIFIGGSPGVAGVARMWVNLARRCGKRVHWGGAGTVPRLFQAFNLGVDSLDSAGPLRSRRSFMRFLAAWKAAVDRATRMTDT